MSSSAMVIPAVIFGLPVAVVAGGYFLAKWLADSTPEDVAAVECLKEEQRRERLLSPRSDRLVSNEAPIRLASANLHLRSSVPLRRTAEKLGYRVVKPVSRQPQILLVRASGERLAIGRDKQGQVTVTANDERYVKDLVRCHTIDRAIDHLKSKGMNIQTASLPNGDIQITGNEKRAKKDGKAEVTTQVHNDGSLFVDVGNINSNRCESIISELAGAVGGDVSNRKSKGGYRLPVSSRRQVKL